MKKDFDEYFVEEKSSIDRLLDLLVFIAVFVVTIFLILEIMGESGKMSIDVTLLREIYFYVNLVVFFIFALDLLRLFRESSDVTDFVKRNWLDILATIPFGLLATAIGPRFEILKLVKVEKLLKAARVSRVSKVSKLSKEFKAASHLKKESDDYKQKHRV